MARKKKVGLREKGFKLEWSQEDFLDASGISMTEFKGWSDQRKKDFLTKAKKRRREIKILDNVADTDGIGFEYLAKGL